MRRRITRWRWATLLIGLALVVLSLMVGAASFMQSNSGDYTGADAPPPSSSLREYQNSEVPVRFYYPMGWHPTPEQEGVEVYPASGSEDFIQQGALFGVYRATGADLPPLPALVKTAITTADTKRTAENVAIGGLSGTEIVKELSLTGSVSDVSTSQVAVALEAVKSDRLTVVVWDAVVDNEHYWVIMADARGGAHLPTLEHIRATIEWE